MPRAAPIRKAPWWRRCARAWPSFGISSAAARSGRHRLCRGGCQWPGGGLRRDLERAVRLGPQRGHTGVVLAQRACDAGGHCQRLPDAGDRARWRRPGGAGGRGRGRTQRHARAIALCGVEAAAGQQLGRPGDLRSTGAAPIVTVNMISCQNVCVALPDPGGHGLGARPAASSAHESSRRCHCGELTYEAEVDPAQVSICHCVDCQILTGTAYRVSVPAKAADFHMLSGVPKIYVKTAESGNRAGAGLLRHLRHADLFLRCETARHVQSAHRPDRRTRAVDARAPDLVPLRPRLGAAISAAWSCARTADELAGGEIIAARALEQRSEAEAA